MKTQIDWLLGGDTSIRFQTIRDLRGSELIELQNAIEIEGWGKTLLDLRKENGHWGLSYYQPKWISTHYTLLDLRNLCISPHQQKIRESIAIIAKHEKGMDGGINPSGTINNSDVCINGMFLNFASYFKTEEKLLHSIVDFILNQKMPDGAFNCRLNRSGARHSSMHTTINTLEGIEEYFKNGYTYRLKELLECKESSIEFLLQHQLFRSDRTGDIIHNDFLKMHYPFRWRYDFLRALDFLQYSGAKWDERLRSAIDWLLNKRNFKNNSWKVHAKHPGKTHFEMEKAGKASRWNTLRALRVLKHFDLLDLAFPDYKQELQVSN